MPAELTCSCTDDFEGQFCGSVKCDPNPCANGGTCEDGACSCEPGFSGILCQDELTSVECDSGSMTVTIDKRLISGDAAEVHFTNKSCFGVESSSNPNEITLTTDYIECGTITEDRNSTVVFSNDITYEKPEAEGDTEITREYQMQLHVECSLDKSETVDGSFKPHLGKVAFSDKSTGTFDLTMKRFESASFANEDSSTVWLGYELFFGVNLNSVQSVGMFIDEAWATAYRDPDSEPRHDLIKDGCPVDETALVYFLEPHQEGFSVDSFRFVGDHEEVYFHSVVKVCGANKSDELRSTIQATCDSINGSHPSTGAPPQDRKRRSSDYLSTQTISSGPFRVRNPTSDMATDDVSSSNPFAMLTLGMIAAVVAMVILMGVAKLVGRSTNYNYQRVSTETIEGI
ncbi:CUB and zona pellucida-like domain-containing protein 1 [Lytechinus variegatus]|uniref:CUB and zona pellucida-like domain-containing protein 1 n=1 Tax=Lytechinus variegatus TaxID=7654 RepID=UPI001BB1ADDE|nr:CUB and zona pellucida-like domain-containing protein 1 [Lytechinus variegatus]XP_041484813.1 CUB and zona pellucida-like domain-containing protein 1 [Lytechinus variegatus]XP_041484814.1 CUB and zona pellucida-like domain-containing protein 1 [Lytechinus variegatus]